VSYKKNQRWFVEFTAILFYGIFVSFPSLGTFLPTNSKFVYVPLDVKMNKVMLSQKKKGLKCLLFFSPKQPNVSPCEAFAVEISARLIFIVLAL
jgi:hypothetical protein